MFFGKAGGAFASRQLLTILVVFVAILAATMTTGAVAQQADRPLFGAYVYGGVWGGEEPIRDAERMLQRDLDIVHWFMSWDHAFDTDLVATANHRGRLPLITWESHGTTVQAIAAGRHDAYVTSWARGVRAIGTAVYLRPFPEMNGDWTPWSGDPDALVAAWRRIAGIFEREGADNVRWVWSPNVTDEPRVHANRMEAYYPGSDVVDVLALDGYNWGTTQPWSAWQSFDEVFAGGYARIAALGPQPIWFAEVSSAEQGGDKAAWIRDMMASTSFDRLGAIVWFHEDKETAWHVDSSRGALAAMREALRPAAGLTTAKAR